MKEYINGSYCLILDNKCLKQRKLRGGKNIYGLPECKRTYLGPFITEPLQK
jgi:hypothetical protein